MLEDSLREAFHRRVESLPMVDDPATVAIRRGRRSRQRRLVAGALTAVLVMVGLLGGSVVMRDWWQPPVTGTNVVNPIYPLTEPLPDQPVDPDAGQWHGGELGVEVRVVNRVWTATGERVLLRGSTLVEQAVRTPYGLVYGSDEQIRLRREGGKVIDLVTAPGPWVVSRDGQRVATVSGTTLQVFGLSSGGLVGKSARATVAAGTAPVSFWGERIVIVDATGDQFDFWDPGAPYQSVWSPLAAVYGQAGDDLLVLTSDQSGSCLARIESGASRLAPAGNQCLGRPRLVGDEVGWLSPTGRWLALPDGEWLQIVPTESEQAELTPVATCPYEERVEAVWWSDTVLLSAAGDAVVSCAVDGSISSMNLPAGVGTLWQFLPSVGLSR